MEEFKTYTVKAKETRAVWVFRYNLEGDLYSFTNLEGNFTVKQSNWLFSGGRFPINESLMSDFITKYKKFFQVEVNIPEVTFDLFYNLYGKKTTKKESFDFWRKMSPADRILAVLGIKPYKNNCKLYQGREQVDPIRYLRNRRFDDEY